MKLIPDFERKFPRLWSVRFGIVAGIFSGLELILPLFQDSFSRGWFAALSFVFTCAALVARVVAQPKLTQDLKDGL